MLSKDTLTKLAAVLSITVEDFENKIKAEKEEALEVPALFNQAQIDLLKKTRFEEGKKAAGEISVKELREKFGIQTETKDFDELFEKYGEKVKSEVLKNPSDREKQLNEDLTKLRDKIKNDSESWGKEKLNLESSIYQERATGQLLGLIPEGTIIPRTDILTLFRSEHEVVNLDGKTAIKKNGQILKDTLEQPVAIDSVVKTWLDERKFVKPGAGGSGGDGGSEGGTPKLKTMTEFMTYCQSKGIAPLSPEGLKLRTELAKDPEWDQHK